MSGRASKALDPRSEFGWYLFQMAGADKFEGTASGDPMNWKSVALASIAILACAPRIAMQPEDSAAEESAVRHVEEEVATATERNDADALAPLLASDFTFVNPAGMLVSKEQFLNNFRSGRLVNSSYKIDEMRVRIYGSAAVVTYRSSVAGTAGLQSLSSERRRTTVLIKRDGKWLIVAQQSTPILRG
jgi:uncharacterized protein (TIGR02246 family)